MDDFDFTDDEIRDQLESLGYQNIPKERLQQFKKDLEQLVHYERSRSNSSMSTNSVADSEHGKNKNHKPILVEQIDTTKITRDKQLQVHSESGTITMSDQNLGLKTETQWKTSENGNSSQLEQVVYHQPNVSIYQPYSRQNFHGLSDEYSVHIAHDDDAVKHPTRQENVFIQPQPISEMLQNKRIMKRKTLRKQNGQSVVDESFTESEQDDLSSMEDRLRHMRLPSDRAYDKRPQSAPPCGDRLGQQSARQHPSQQASDDFCPQSGLIHPMADHPHTRNIRRDDPVSRYQRYSQIWRAQQAPGEKDHRNLRWNVRELMIQHDGVPKKSRRYFIPNNYVIPGERKHSALRWQIREDLAQGFVPSSFYD